MDDGFWENSSITGGARPGRACRIAGCSLSCVMKMRRALETGFLKQLIAASTRKRICSSWKNMRLCSECWWELFCPVSLFLLKGWAWVTMLPSGMTCTWIYAMLFAARAPMREMMVIAANCFQNVIALTFIVCKITEDQ